MSRPIHLSKNGIKIQLDCCFKFIDKSYPASTNAPQRSTSIQCRAYCSTLVVAVFRLFYIQFLRAVPSFILFFRSSALIRSLSPMFSLFRTYLSLPSHILAVPHIVPPSHHSYCCSIHIPVVPPLFRLFHLLFLMSARATASYLTLIYFKQDYSKRIKVETSDNISILGAISFELFCLVFLCSMMIFNQSLKQHHKPKTKVICGLWSLGIGNPATVQVQNKFFLLTALPLEHVFGLSLCGEKVV